MALFWPTSQKNIITIIITIVKVNKFQNTTSKPSTRVTIHDRFFPSEFHKQNTRLNGGRLVKTTCLITKSLQSWRWWKNPPFKVKISRKVSCSCEVSKRRIDTSDATCIVRAAWGLRIRIVCIVRAVYGLQKRFELCK